MANGRELREAPTPGQLGTIVAGLPNQPLYFFYGETPSQTFKNNLRSPLKRKAWEMEDELKEDGDEEVKEEDDDDNEGRDEAPPPAYPAFI